MDFLSVNSGFEVHNDGTYLLQITKEICISLIIGVHSQFEVKLEIVLSFHKKNKVTAEKSFKERLGKTGSEKTILLQQTNKKTKD